jgi:hypothetical protein
MSTYIYMLPTKIIYVYLLSKIACTWMTTWLQMEKSRKVLGRKLMIGHHILYTCWMSVVVGVAPSMIKESNPAKSVEIYNNKCLPQLYFSIDIYF